MNLGDEQFEVWKDGTLIMTGAGARVVYYNLTGRNFDEARQHPWREASHEAYLRMMERQLGVEIPAGCTLALYRVGDTSPIESVKLEIQPDLIPDADPSETEASA